YYTDEYQKKARELKERQTEIALRIEQHQKSEGDFRTRLESLISLASRAAVRWTGCGKWLMQLVGRRARSDRPWRRHDTRGKPRRSPQHLPIVHPTDPPAGNFGRLEAHRAQELRKLDQRHVSALQSFSRLRKNRRTCRRQRRGSGRPPRAPGQGRRRCPACSLVAREARPSTARRSPPQAAMPLHGWSPSSARSASMSFPTA